MKLGFFVLMVAHLSACAVQASSIPGTKLNVDWPKLISGQDIILKTPPEDTVRGLLLGNGDIGVSVYGRPECVTLQVGKNDIWDYRDPIDSMRSPFTQSELVKGYGEGDTETRKHVDAVSNELWSGAYCKPYHCSKPAGQIRFRNSGLKGADFASRLNLWEAEVFDKLGSASLRTFVPYQRNVIVAYYDPGETKQFDIELARHKDATGTIPNGPEFGAEGRDIWVRYKFPTDPATYPQGFEYVMYGRIIGGEVTTETIAECGKVVQDVWLTGNVEVPEGQAVAHVRSSKPVTLFVAVATTRDSADPFGKAKADVEAVQQAGLSAITKTHREFWQSFWQRSFVQIDNPFLMQHWFVSNYHLACCSKPSAVAPGLYGNWTWQDASAWWDDYHWDYNFQQTFWATYSSNHLEQAVPYNYTVMALLPAAKAEARKIYGLEGAKFFISTYPRNTSRNPYPAIPWDRIMCISAWASQEMWYYFLYSQDKDYLAKEAYPVMVECAKFYEGFLTKDANGKYNICPTVSPEHWGMTAKFERNKNCTLDIALIKYLMNACIQASEILKVDEAKRPVWKNIVENLPAYPMVETPQGTVFADVEGAPMMKLYNVPVPAMAMFPGDDIGLHSPQPLREIAERTVNSLHYNLANQYVMLPMTKVRLGLNCLEEFEKATRELRQPGGAIIDATMPWIWAENFAAPLVINECLVQSYNGILRFAPVKLKGGAAFGGLRTVGAFTVSGEIKPDGSLAYAAITSEAGGKCSFYGPWEGKVRLREASSMQPVTAQESMGVFSFATSKGETYIIDRAEDPWEKQPQRSLSAPDRMVDSWIGARATTLPLNASWTQ